MNEKDETTEVEVVDAELVEDGELPEGPEALDEEPAPSDVAIAFLCDSRASTLLLADTVAWLLGSRRVDLVYLELHSAAGRTIASRLADDHVPYAVVEMGLPLPEDDPRVASLVEMAASIAQVDPAGLGALPAQLCVVPAMVGAGEDYVDASLDKADLDFSPSTLPGVVLEQAEAAGRHMMVVDTPERGLVNDPAHGMRRRVLHVGTSV